MGDSEKNLFSVLKIRVLTALGSNVIQIASNMSSGLKESPGVYRKRKGLAL
jgi:hypothetical protein